MFFWENIRSFYYNEQEVRVEAFDTKGGQLSIFDDGLEGALHFRLYVVVLKEEVPKLSREEQAELIHFMVELLAKDDFQLSEAWKAKKPGWASNYWRISPRSQKGSKQSSLEPFFYVPLQPAGSQKPGTCRHENSRKFPKKHVASPPKKPQPHVKIHLLPR